MEFICVEKGEIMRAELPSWYDDWRTACDYDTEDEEEEYCWIDPYDAWVDERLCNGESIHN